MMIIPLSMVVVSDATSIVVVDVDVDVDVVVDESSKNNNTEIWPKYAKTTTPRIIIKRRVGTARG
jgi:hypothetical protein